MSKPINYYIQLSDELSTAIDAMSKESLTVLAEVWLSMYNSDMSQDYYTVTIDNGINVYAFNRKELLTLCYGLLAKAV